MKRNSDTKMHQTRSISKRYQTRPLELLALIALRQNRLPIIQKNEINKDSKNK